MRRRFGAEFLSALLLALSLVLQMAQLAFFLGSLGGLLGVAFGAFGAHALRDRLDAYSLGVFETAVQYQFYHSFALLAAGMLLMQFPSSVLLKSSVFLFLLGMVLFCGSLYLLSFSGLRWLGAITPLGGLAFIAGWACLAAAGWQLLGQ
ncbi:product YwdK [gamma proteobacterium NOR5-3]|nr:product YwdK [gamma proteobacterium NOR5-3]